MTERPENGDSTDDGERAVSRDGDEKDERAGNEENPDHGERAEEDESPAPEDRADDLASPEEAERANGHESTGNSERAAHTESSEGGEQLEAVERLSRDIRDAASMLSSAEARYLVSTYYEVQEQRIRAAAQVRASKESGEPNRLLVWAETQYRASENNARRGLQAYAEHHEVGRWSLSITGIGPVIAAGLLAHIDLEPWRCRGERKGATWKPCRAGAPCTAFCGTEPTRTVGKIWRFAGLDPTVKWGKGERRPWNADLKVLCWKLGESFVKTSGSEHEVYGSVYRARKELELGRNEAGQYADQAAASLEARKYGADTVARAWYEQGKLPPARLHLRAQRYAVKLFLSHWHHVAYESKFGEPPPKPYVLEHLGHTDYLAPPNWPMGGGR